MSEHEHEEEVNEEELAYLRERVNLLPDLDRGSADYTSGYLVGYRAGLQTAFLVAFVNEDEESVTSIREEYEGGNVGLLHVALLAMGQATEADRELVKKYASHLAILAGQEMYRRDIIEGVYAQALEVQMEGKIEREFGLDSDTPSWMDEEAG